MMFETVGQAGIFLAMVYAGLAVGLLYDGARLARRLLAAGAVITGIVDLLFWLAAGVVVSVALALRGEDSVRLYALAGCASGAVLYLLGVSRALRAVGQAVARAYRRVEETPKWQAKLEKQRLRQQERREQKALAKGRREQEKKTRGVSKP
ncbi:MAG: spore cortex biosynthesis protein YabQ [Clostridia bacterium]|nr:spore cortex biosynthesis protein YabQ [Clostridia bacterium]